MVNARPKTIISAENLVWIMYFGDHDDCVQAQILMNTHEPFDEKFGCGHEEAIEITDARVAQCICHPMTRAQAKIEALRSLTDGGSTTTVNYETSPRSKRGKKRKTVSKTAISSACSEERDTTSSAPGQTEPKRHKSGTATSRLVTSYVDAPDKGKTGTRVFEGG
jgi:hypothetical protein